MSTATLDEHNVIAAFRDLEHADEALAVLHEDGFVDSELSILGRPVDEVDLEDDEHESGESVGGPVGREIAAGAATGATAGGAATALATAAVATIPGIGLAAGTGALIGFVSGAGAGGTVGAILGGEAGLRTNATWTQALETIRQGAVVLGVHGPSATRIERAQELLDAVEPMSVHRVNEQGMDVRKV